MTDVSCPVLVLESRSTTVFIPGKKYGEEADQQVTISVQTSFWSYVDVDSSPKKHPPKDNLFLGQMVNTHLVRSLLLTVTAEAVCTHYRQCRRQSLQDSLWMLSISAMVPQGQRSNCLSLGLPFRT